MKISDLIIFVTNLIKCGLFFLLINVKMNLKMPQTQL